MVLKINLKSVSFNRKAMSKLLKMIYFNCLTLLCFRIYENYVYPSVEFPGLVIQYSYDPYDTENKIWYDVKAPIWKYNGTILLRTK